LRSIRWRKFLREIARPPINGWIALNPESALDDLVVSDDISKVKRVR